MNDFSTITEEERKAYIDTMTEEECQANYKNMTPEEIEAVMLRDTTSTLDDLRIGDKRCTEEEATRKDEEENAELARQFNARPKSEETLRREAWTTYMTPEECDRQRAAMVQELPLALLPLFSVCEGRLAVRGKSLLKKEVLNGVYDLDHVNNLMRDLMDRSISDGYMWWCTLNPFDESVETTNTLSWGFGVPKTKITRACWLVIDFDPTRTEPEANTDEREAARVLMEEVHTLLQAWEFPEPWVVMSGNGYQLRYRVDLPADSDSERLLKRVMLVLDKTFTNDAVKVDTSLWDLPRVCKIPGTYSRKGMPTVLIRYHFDYESAQI